MNAMLLTLGAGCAVLLQGMPVAAQTEVAARRECMQAMREQGVRGFALSYPRFVRTSEGASLNGRMVQGPAWLEFTCQIDRRAKVRDLTMTRPAD